MRMNIMRRVLPALICLAMTSPAVAASRAWIAEFTTVRVEAQAPIARIAASVHQPAIDLTGGANKTAAKFNATTKYIRVTCEVQCAIRISTDATGSAIVLPPGRPEYFAVDGGTQMSVIAVP